MENFGVQPTVCGRAGGFQPGARPSRTAAVLRPAERPLLAGTAVLYLVGLDRGGRGNPHLRPRASGGRGTVAALRPLVRRRRTL